MRTMTTREALLAWVDQLENDHYEFEAYGDRYIVNLEREKVEAAIDIAITLVNRVVAAKGDLHTAEYEELEARVRREHPEDSGWLFQGHRADDCKAVAKGIPHGLRSIFADGAARTS